MCNHHFHLDKQKAVSLDDHFLNVVAIYTVINVLDQKISIYKP